MAGTLTLAAVAAGGTLGYASYDNEFRKTVEEAVPGAEAAFELVLGEKEPEKGGKALAPTKPPLPKIPVTSAPPSKLRPIVVKEKEVKEEAKPAVEEVSKPTQKSEARDDTLVVVTPPPLEKPSYIEDDTKKKKEQQQEAVAPAAVSDTSPPLDEHMSNEDREFFATETKREDDPAPVSQKSEPRRRRVVAPEIDSDDDSEQAILEGKDLHKQISLVRDNMEAEMVSQLRRQAEAHTEHLDDSLDVQKRELTRKHRRELDEALAKAELQHKEDIAKILGQLQGLNEGLQGRAEMDMASLEAQELWLACTSLMQAVANGGNSFDAKEVRSLRLELRAVRKAAVRGDHEDPFVKAVLQSIPDEVSTRGVYTEESIRERFRRVEKVARRTALIGDEGGSLMRYLLSYLQSLFILSPSTDELPSKSVPVDVDALDTFDLVWLAKGHLERGDLDQAVRYVTLLRGEPRNAAGDWLREARMLLETKQACMALLAHAAAVGVEALPQRK